MSDRNKEIDVILRRARRRYVMKVFVLPGLVILGLSAFFFRSIAATDPLGRSYRLAEIVLTEDVSSGTGVTFEVTARFDQLQKVFQTDDPAIIDALGATVCVMEWRGAKPGDGVPAPRYHKLVPLDACDAS